MAYVNNLFNTNFLEYASYVIKDRAIPHIDDGLKPVQRRILHSLIEMDDGKFHKVANVVGHCMKYHPHGDQSINSALVVLANKEIFIDKQGNFGNILTGDEASAARYIECRILPFAKKVLHNPELTQYEDSYDGRNKEPVVFPAKIPLILVMGAEGIAVGMSTKILPHNLIEVLKAVKAQLQGQAFTLLPDFPTGGVLDASGYDGGMGKVLVRATLDTSDPKRIIIRELPFGTTTESLIASIENAARKGKLKIAGINDFTTDQVEIEVSLARGVYTQETVDALYAFTDCEVSISVNLLVIRDNMPVSMRVEDVIAYHAEKLMVILKRELELEAGHLEDKLHARTLERIFIEERIYKRIEEMETAAKVSQAVRTGFEPFMAEIRRPITDEDIERLLKIPIRRISLYDINKARKEMEEMEGRLKEIRHHLKHLREYALGYLDGLIQSEEKRFPRLTKIQRFDKVDVREAAARTLKLRYDGSSGYLGTEVPGGDELFAVNEFDRLLVIRSQGDYSVIPVPHKTHVGADMRHCCIADKDELGTFIYTVVYKNTETGHFYVKRTTITQFIIEKTYTLLPDAAKLIAFTTQEKGRIILKYKKKPNLRVLEEEFQIGDFLVKGVNAQGVRLTTKDVSSLRITKT
ncbi:DNA topoisomerase IV subunit A [Spirochaeta lutea]|uniref:DNA topoisomerase IV subunit A n=1 Tax=Spirochaeta lutea TaxID=1480694 RepID=A0A098QW53_9SPIO|nr:DNA topoisomerase IV subunit A [Spirochaeta lutea]KGE70732.1 DNA topoisomerase IV subunit A [Spirochaeta lutea]